MLAIVSPLWLRNLLVDGTTIGHRHRPKRSEVFSSSALESLGFRLPWNYLSWLGHGEAWMQVG